MLKNSKYFVSSLLTKPEASVVIDRSDHSASRIKASKIGEPSLNIGRQNTNPTPTDIIVKRQREQPSPARTTLQDIPINQYDSVLVNSRFEQIKRKYDSQLKRNPEPQTPVKDTSCTTSIPKKELSYNSQEKYMGSESKTQLSRSTWEYKENRSAAKFKEREMENLAEQVKEIRRSVKVEEFERGRTYSKATITSPQVPCFGKPYERAPEDPRVESIDRINLKIKQILNCLNQNQKINQQPTTSNVYLPVDHVSKDRQLVKQRQTRQTRDYRDKEKEFSKLPESRASVTNKIENSKVSTDSLSNYPQNRLSLVNKVNDIKEEPRRYSLYTQKVSERMQRPQSAIPMKSSVLINHKNQTSQNKGSQCILSSGKDLDQEIRKIEEKIKKSQDQKSKLGIKYSMRVCDLGLSSKKSTISTASLTTMQAQTKNPSVNQPFIQPEQTLQSISIPRLQKYQFSQKKPSTAVQSSPKFKQPSIRQSVSKDYLIPNPIVSSTSANLGLPKTFSGSSNLGITSTSINLDNSSVKLKEESPVSNCRPKIPVVQTNRVTKFQTAPAPIPQIQTKRLVDRLKQQVSYDEEFRNSKLNFAALSDPQKWSKLRQELKKKGVYLGDSELREEFELSLEQHNPFYSVRETQEPPESVAAKYISSVEFWKNKLCKNFDQKALTNEGFKMDRIDLERKGHLTVEDFVRFLNIETGTFYRNRDLILIFRRLSPDTNITFQLFMKTVCR